MDNGYSNEPMLDIYIYETTQNLEQLEAAILRSEKARSFSADTVNEIFRIMHTIKGSSAMMLFNDVASLAHTIEDLFYYIREDKPGNVDTATLSDLVLEGADFIKLELEKVKNADSVDGDPAGLIESIKEFLATIKGDAGTAEAAAPKKGKKAKPKEPEEARQYYIPQGRTGASANPDQKAYEAVIFFEDGCEMENIRAYAVIHNLKDIVEDFVHYPDDIIEDLDSIEVIREQGFRIVMRTDKPMRELNDFFMSTAFLRDLELNELQGEAAEELAAPAQSTTIAEAPIKVPKVTAQEPAETVQVENRSSHQSIISVDVLKLDKLMDLMGEMVIAEAMVTQNPELAALKLNSFHKASRQLQKITSEMQDMVMSIRMVPLSATFHKMHRIVRDMSRKLGKEVELTLVGEETEVDKNIIEHISDPLMHLVRNSVDHGIEDGKARTKGGKPKVGQVTLEAKNAGSEVLVVVRDDGQGLNREKILKKATEQGILTKPAGELTDREVFNLIFLPGFSTNSAVTEFSGRGVGMDVVTKNLEAVGGTVSVDSAEGAGTVTTLKIPLTLAIIDGMNIQVGATKYTLPTTSIQETFRARMKDIVRDPDGNEAIMVRGQCYPILRLHRMFGVETTVTELTRGIMLMVEQDGKSFCLFADELLGQHQVVVKALPDYIKGTKKVDGLAGCTLLGDGSISLILNIGGLVSMWNSVA